MNNVCVICSRYRFFVPARDPKPCEVHSSFYRNGKRVVKKRLYRDGEQVQPDCSHMCTCQNGNFGCVSLCPQEEKKPSKKHCKNPRLVTVAGQCCGEWWCDTDTNYTRRVEIKSGSTSNVIAYDPRRDENYIRHGKGWWLRSWQKKNILFIILRAIFVNICLPLHSFFFFFFLFIMLCWFLSFLMFKFVCSRFANQEISVCKKKKKTSPIWRKVNIVIESYKNEGCVEQEFWDKQW